MDHFELYFDSRKRIITIIVFMLVLVILPMFGSFIANNARVFFSAIAKLIILGIFSTYLLQGAKWAKAGILVLASLSAFQAVLGISRMNNTYEILFYTFLLLSFGYIIWYLESSKSFEEYRKLKLNGFEPFQRNKIKLSEIIDEREIIKLKFKEFKLIEDYIPLLYLLFDRAGLINSILSIESEGDSKINIETQNALFEIGINNRLDLFDNSMISKVNAILEQMGEEDRFIYIYPESILEIDTTTHYLLYTSADENEELWASGYAKQTKVLSTTI